MNLIEFKEYGVKIDVEALKMFRVWVENTCNTFYQLEEREETQSFYDMEDDEKHSSVEYENFQTDWNDVSIYAISKLHSKLGWKNDELWKDKNLKHYDESDCFEYSLNMYSELKKILDIDDDIVFFYAICSFNDCVDENSKIYEHLIKNILMGIRHYNLQEHANLIESNEEKESVFIAMSFNRDMHQARRKIEDAITRCGYKPILIDEKQHNNYIVPEIFFEIRRSKFIIADLTGNRGGVYYEAGYATACEKPVILMCKKSEEKPHFDVAQINTIFWECEDEIEEKLIKRIEATIGKKIL